MMGTLLFHILLFAVFLLSEVEMKREMKEAEVVVEIPLEWSEEPEELEEAATGEERLEGNLPSQ
ncbi:MAG TPA: hypothetical protein PKJ58_08970, partial [Prolixibacteraceae bacterium]|nr:hypothetical protein [Prolixibacteraceae bacterium]